MEILLVIIWYVCSPVDSLVMPALITVLFAGVDFCFAAVVFWFAEAFFLAKLLLHDVFPQQRIITALFLAIATASEEFVKALSLLWQQQLFQSTYYSSFYDFA
jgi:hypothetical protein